MIGSSTNAWEFTCPVPGHHPDKLLLVCQDSRCSSQGLICARCYNASHLGHQITSVHTLPEQARELGQQVAQAAKATVRRAKEAKAAVAAAFGGLQE